MARSDGTYVYVTHVLARFVERKIINLSRWHVHLHSLSVPNPVLIRLVNPSHLRSNWHGHMVPHGPRSPYQLGSYPYRTNLERTTRPVHTRRQPVPIPSNFLYRAYEFTGDSPKFRVGCVVSRLAFSPSC